MNSPDFGRRFSREMAARLVDDFEKSKAKNGEIYVVSAAI
jgi:hypothetical protein